MLSVYARTVGALRNTCTTARGSAF